MSQVLRSLNGLATVCQERRCLAQVEYDLSLCTDMRGRLSVTGQLFLQGGTLPCQERVRLLLELPNGMQFPFYIVRLLASGLSDHQRCWVRLVGDVHGLRDEPLSQAS